MIFIYSMFLYVNYEITMVITIVIIINTIIIVKTVSKTIKKKGIKRSGLQANYYEVINSSLANFKMIKLQIQDNIILEKFHKATKDYAQVGIITATLKSAPKMIFEAISFSLVISLVIYLVYKYEDDASSHIGLLSIFVLGLYRFMPSVNKILDGYNNIMYQYKALDIVHNDLIYDIEDIGNKKVNFESLIKIKNLSFGYIEGQNILQDINLEINKGDKVAFIGESGSGKSTLIDLLIGLYKPCSGGIFVDDNLLCDSNIKSWRNKVGYIPQSVYLFDGTVAENVVFNRKYDEQKITEVLKKAKLYDFLQEKEGLLTVVGEGGILLSGGQKQRIAIARAL
ncbi:ABC transporter ATP-binding protein, partial [Arcobacter sp. 31_11_sub10_T18]